jgi:DNA-binding GntR family transcriptional regulator
MSRDDTTGTAQRLHVRIAGLLAAEIAGGQHPPGAHLVEAQLAQRFGVSRAPVRLALARLTRDGWLDYQPARGHTVRPTRPSIADTPDTPGDPDRPPQDGAGDPGGIGARHAWETIYARVEDAITARIAFGSWLVPEPALARAFSVSRTVARDVLARLQGRGLVEMQGGRWVAPGLDARRVDELYRLRALLEPAALREIGADLPPGLVAGALARLRAAADGAPDAPPDAAPDGAPDGATLDALEQDLHVDLLGRCGNATLLAAIRQPQALLIAHRFLYRATAALFGTEPFIAEHLAVFEALARGQTDAATRHLHDHLMESRTRAVLRLDFLRAAADGPDGPDSVPYLRPIPAG